MADEALVQIQALLPNLRAFANAITRNRDLADDLVQETIIKAWKNWDQFSGASAKPWLFSILRNCYISHIRKHRREVEDADGHIAGTLAVKASQSAHMDLIDFEQALAQLPGDQREAILLIGAEGFSYEEAALMCGVAVGTIKSRVSRARHKLAELMGVQGAEDIGDGSSAMPMQHA